MTEFAFVFLSLGAATLASIMLIRIYMRKRFLFVKPSLQVILALHLLLQWPLAIRSSFAYHFLVTPTHALALVAGSVLVSLMLAERTFVKQARAVFRRIQTNSPGTSWSRESKLASFWLLTGVAGTAGLYLSSVTISGLGLIVSFVDPDSAAAAREESFKLIANPLVRYSFSILTSVIAPMAATLSAFSLQAHINSRYFLGAGVQLLVLGSLIVIVSLTGARYFAVATILSVILGFIIRNRFQVRIFSAAVLAICALLPAVLLTMIRQDSASDIALLPTYFLEFIVHRMLSAPTDVSLWYMHHAQVFGTFGLGGIPKLASLAGVPALNAPNVIGLHYYPTNISSIHANGSFVFTYYSYFGLPAMFLSTPLILSLDLLLPLIRYTARELLVPTLATMSVAALSFAQSDYTVSLVSHGYAATPIFAVLLSSWIFFWHSKAQDKK